MEIVNIDDLMREKLSQCEEFLNGKDEAIAKRDEARLALEKAEAALAEYDNADYVATIVAYRDDLRKRLGIVDEVVAEAHDEQLGEECAEQDPAPVVFVEQPLI
nr:MAG TPA: hypothetical protein [Caudoviricetes sp.]